MSIAIILLFLLLSALFSGSEIAFISANKLRIELKKKKGASRGNILAKFYDNPDSFLGTMLVGNNIALVVFTIMMTNLLHHYYEAYFSNNFVLLLFDTFIITCIVLIFGEFLPKTLFRLYADDILYFLAYPLKLIQFLMAIPSWIMSKLSNLVLRLLVKPTAETDEASFTRIDLENFIKDSQTDEAYDIDKELFGKALNLKETRVRDSMVPRPEIESIDITAGVEELEQLFIETKLSRIVVIDGEIDNVLGYVHHQQLLSRPKSIRSLLLEIPFVPEVMRVSDLMNKLIKENISIACVVDEFGSVSGVITLEDILEEIFGEIEDEHDEEEYIEKQISDTEWVFSGRLEIDYLNEKYEAIDLPEGEYQTLSGYLVMTTETIPEQGAEIELNDYLFILELVSDTKIETVRLVKLDPKREIEEEQ
jgi:putative hemolysin